ncbi:SpoIIE family protein phosphatase [Anaerolineales bacterium HSG25]|nr:SpoIIE family protein phosphatase [Anaerolineales bacterium HSG25]
MNFHKGIFITLMALTLIILLPPIILLGWILPQLYSWTTSLLIIMGLILFALGMSLFVIKRAQQSLLAPIEHLNRAATAINQGQRDQQLPTDTLQELTPLVEQFNLLLSENLTHHEKIDEYGRTLKEKVKLRTAQLEEQVDQLSTLNMITQTVASVRDLDMVLKIVARTLGGLFNAKNSGIALLNDKRTHLKVVAEYTRDARLASHMGLIIPLENNLSSAQVIETNRTVVVQSAQTNPLTEQIHDILRDRNTHCLMIVPLLSRGEVIGTIGLNTDDPERVFTETEVSLSETIAGQIAGVIDNARLFKTERAAREQAETLQATTQALSRTLDLQQVFELILRELRKVVPYDSASVQQLKGNRMEIIGGFGFENLNEIIGSSFDLHADNNPNWQVVNGRAPVILANSAADYQEFHLGIESQPETSAWLGVPLLFGDELIGMLALDKYEHGFYNDNHTKIAISFASQAAIAVENAHLYAEAQAAREQLKAENLRLAAEVDVVQRLQQMVLPSNEELEQFDGLEIAGFMEPADEVGGDYYDVLQHKGQIKIGVGDVSGHGLESGVLMLMTQVAVRVLLTSGETDPVRFMDILNRTLYANVQRMHSDKMLTLLLLDYEPMRSDNPTDIAGQIHVTGQHEELIVVRKNGTIECFDTIDLGFPIALDEDIRNFVDQTTIQLAPGDGIVLYTDGITEAANESDQLYGLECLCDVIAQNWHKSAEQVKKAVVSDVKSHIQRKKIYDDLTLLIIKQK